MALNQPELKLGIGKDESGPLRQSRSMGEERLAGAFQLARSPLPHCRSQLGNRDVLVVAGIVLRRRRKPRLWQGVTLPQPGGKRLAGERAVLLILDPTRTSK